MSSSQTPTHAGPTVTVTVFFPAATDPREFTWPKSKKVGEAATEAASAFGVTDGSPTFENSEDQVLDRNKPLVAAGVRTGDKLELVDVGGGV